MTIVKSALLLAIILRTGHGSWEYPGGLPDRYVSCTAAFGDHLYAGTWGTGVYKCSGVDSCMHSGSGLMNNRLYCLLPVGSSLLAGTDGDGVYRSEDSGATWHASDSGLLDGHVFSLASEGSVVLAGTWKAGLHRSNNAGKNWTRVQGVLANEVMYSLVCLDSIVIAGTSRLGVLRSSDTGKTWKPWGLEGESVPTLTSTDDAVLAGTWSSGLFRRHFTDSEWHGVPVGDRPVLVISRGRGNVIYTGHQGGGIYGSRDNGANWTPHGLLDCDVVGITPVGDCLFAATWGCGLYRACTADAGWKVKRNRTAAPPADAVRTGIRQGTLIDPGDVPSHGEILHAVACRRTSLAARSAGRRAELRFTMPRPLETSVSIVQKAGVRVASVRLHVDKGSYRAATRSAVRPGVHIAELRSNCGWSSRLFVVLY